MSRTSYNSYRCTLTTLSPVHVGCGEKYVKNLDYIVHARSLLILGKRKLFSLLEKICDEKDVMALTESLIHRRLKEWLESKDINYREVTETKYPWNESSIPREIHKGIKNAWGEPIIPGSSVKGALRTAILKDLNDKDGRNTLTELLNFVLSKRRFNDNQLKRLDQKLTTELLGKDPNHDLMRTLLVGDFRFSKDAFTLRKVVVKTLKSNGRLGDKAYKIYPEMLRIGTCGLGNITIDGFLFEEDARYSGEIFGFSTRITFDYVRRVANNASLDTVKQEIDFFETRDRQIADFYKQMKNQIKGLGENEIIIRISWGSGWKSMTGELIPKDQLSKELREALKLAPHKWPAEFPKTRKIVHTRTGKFPLGWVKLTFENMDTVRKEEKKKQMKKAARLKELERLRAEEERKKREEQERKAYLESLSPEERDIEIVKDASVPEQKVVEIYNRIDSFSEANRKKLAEALKEYWIKNNKWGGKLSNKQKIKVRRVKEILGEL